MYPLLDIVDKLSSHLEKLAGARVEIEEPPKREYGDLSTSIALRIAKRERRNPEDVARDLLESLPEIDYVRSAEVLGGFINFRLDRESFSNDVVNQIIDMGKDYGSFPPRGTKIVLEHTSANPDGPLHIGHLRNAVIGDSLARILRKAGHDVEVHYYVNDMGRQIAIIAWWILERGLDLDSYLESERGRGEKVDRAIMKLYVEANREFEKDQEKNEERLREILRRYEGIGGERDRRIVEIFRRISERCLEGIKETLDSLGIKHDLFVFESEFIDGKDGISVSKVIELLRERGLLSSDSDPKILDLSNHGIEKEMVLTREDGSSLYPLRDIAYHIWKSRRGSMVNVLGADHKLEARQISIVLKLLGYPEPRVIFYEFITLPEGSMSTRAGRIVSADELIEESLRRAREEVIKRRGDLGEEKLSRISKIVGIGAVKFNIARVASDKPMTFRWEDALDFERSGSPFIQYAHARACSIIRKSGGIEPRFDGKLIEHEAEWSLVMALAKFPLVVRKSSEELRVHLVANYLVELARRFNDFYKDVPVLSAGREDLVRSRLALVEASKIVLENGLDLLGIEAPEEM